MTTPIAVPTVKKVGSSFADFGIGAIGGLGFLLLYQIFGPLGVIAAPLIVGSMIKGPRGEIIATMAGFALFAIGGLAVSGGNGASADSGDM